MGQVGTPSGSIYLQVNMGCVLAVVFQVHSLYISLKQSTFWVCFRESLVLSRLYSDISIEAQCGTINLPLGDCDIMWAALCEKVLNILSRCHTKPSFGMTTTQDIRDLFAYHCPCLD